jgi:hypothetical protein
MNSMRSQQFIIVDGTVCKGAVTDKYKQVDKEQYSANTLFRLILPRLLTDNILGDHQYCQVLGDSQLPYPVPV